MRKDERVYVIHHHSSPILSHVLTFFVILLSTNYLINKMCLCSDIQYLFTEPSDKQDVREGHFDDEDISLLINSEVK
jgi:hypothetical protein